MIWVPQVTARRSVALYARVSTERQERERTIGSQVEALQARAAAEGWAVEMSCADDGHYGARLDRPGLDQVRDAAAAGRIDAVVALCPDRLARNYVHQALVLEELARFGVRVIFVEGGHAADPQGRLLAQIQAVVAEFERTKIVDRNRRGKLWRARQGEVVSGAVPYGYRKVRVAAGQPGRVEVCEQEATIVRQASGWHANDGLSIRQIAIRLIEAQIPSPKGKHIWRPATVDALLRQEAYAGTLYYNRRITRADGPRLPRYSAEHQPLTQSRPREEWIGIAVPTLVNLDTWSRSQAQHSRNARFSPRRVESTRSSSANTTRQSMPRTTRSAISGCGDSSTYGALPRSPPDSPVTTRSLRPERPRQCRSPTRSRTGPNESPQLKTGGDLPG